jgi:ribonuclease D
VETPPSDAADEVTRPKPTSLVTTERGLREAVERLSKSPRVAVDVESNGLFRYRATLCVLQLATPDEVIVVDPLAVALGPLAELLGPSGPTKIVHDVAFDARLLAEASLVLANVVDTSVVARMLGRSATGLASLLEAELGVRLDKKLQHHDWTERPLRAEHLRYLAEDVAHLGALAERLLAEAERAGITEATEEETRYRLAQAIAAAGTVDSRPPYLRLKGIDRVPPDELPILRRLADVREERAKGLDVPPYKVIGADVLFAIARARPTTLEELSRVKGATAGPRARSLGPAMLEAVARGLEDGAIPEEERAMLERPRPPQADVKARRARESRLMSWRKAEAKRRAVDEQVVLPGHCLQDLADLGDRASLDTIAQVPGIGAFRVARDGQTILSLLLDDARPQAPPAADCFEDDVAEPEVAPS